MSDDSSRMAALCAANLNAAPDSPLRGARALMIVCGGVAAYKTLDLTRRLRERGARVQAVMTSAAKQFVAPLALASLTGQRVYDDLFSLTDETEMGHIQLSRASDLLLVVPATADFLAKAAHGLGDDLASTLVLASDKRPIFAPAMNVRMWLNPATQRNVALLKEFGAFFLGPADGEMACGEFGPGRMIEPLEIVAGLEALILKKSALSYPAPQSPGFSDVAAPGVLAGRRAIVTAGPTQEAIDPVRYISNHSSGKQGYAIAAALAQAGADVTLVSGPTALSPPPGVRLTSVLSARDMLAATRAALPADIFIATAAVADWRVKKIAPGKIKKGAEGPPTLAFVENPDILATIAQSPERPRLVVGFAAETENLIANARAKRTRKNCDFLLANDVGGDPAIFGGDHNRVVLIARDHEEIWPHSDKNEVARRLIEVIARTFHPTKDHS